MIEVLLFLGIGLVLGVVITVIIQLTVIIQKLNQLLLMDPRSPSSPGQGQIINVNIDKELASRQPAATQAAQSLGNSSQPDRIQSSMPVVPERPQDPVRKAATLQKTAPEELPGAAAIRKEGESSGAEKAAEALPKTSSALGVVKCPRCGMDNSAFRKICFNCNGSL